MRGLPILSVLIFLPLAAGILLCVVRSAERKSTSLFALAVSGLTLAIALVLSLEMNPSQRGPQFVERHAWIPSLGVEYFLGIDGLGLVLVLLTALLGLMVIAATIRTGQGTPLYLGLILLLQSGLFGTFTALNFFHWFLFWEVSLIPAFFLIRLFGDLRRNAAATQFFLYTMVGSIALLVAFLAVFLATGTFDFIRLAEMGRSGALQSALGAKLNWAGMAPENIAMLVFFGLFLGFAIKVPLFPFHTWLPLTYSEAPTTTTMLLTGAMSKMGMYGFLRILLPLFPDQMRTVLTPLLWLAVLTIVLSALAACAQNDLKKIFAYSSINHLGYCLLGAFAVLKWSEAAPSGEVDRTAALNGVLLQMFNHGITAATLFCFVAFIEQRSSGLRSLSDFGGLRKKVPLFCGLMGITVFASLGLPGLNGFVGEFLIFKGVFPLTPWAAALATLGLLFTAIFLLTLMQKLFHGPLTERHAAFSDLSVAERWIVGPAVALMLLIGLFPQSIIAFTHPAVAQIIERIRP